MWHVLPHPCLWWPLATSSTPSQGLRSGGSAAPVTTHHLLLPSPGPPHSPPPILLSISLATLSVPHPMPLGAPPLPVAPTHCPTAPQRPSAPDIQRHSCAPALHHILRHSVAVAAESNADRFYIVWSDHIPPNRSLRPLAVNAERRTRDPRAPEVSPTAPPPPSHTRDIPFPVPPPPPFPLSPLPSTGFLVNQIGGVRRRQWQSISLKPALGRLLR